MVSSAPYTFPLSISSQTMYTTYTMYTNSLKLISGLFDRLENVAVKGYSVQD